MSKTTAPDIQGGSITNGLSRANAWVTEIQAVLDAPSEAGFPPIYLAHECRNENILTTPGGTDMDREMFMSHRPYQFITYSQGNRFYQIPHVETVIASELAATCNFTEVDGFLVPQPVSQQDWVSKVVCPERDVEAVDIDSLLSAMRDYALDIRGLYMRVAFRLDGTEWRLICPCRYINFSNADFSSAPYVQPISGYVVFPRGDSFLHGYIACHLSEQGSKIEFLGPRYTNAYALLSNQYRLAGQGLQAMETLSRTLPGYAQVFSLRVVVEGQVSFFRYAT